MALGKNDKFQMLSLTNGDLEIVREAAVSIRIDLAEVYALESCQQSEKLTTTKPAGRKIIVR